MQFKKRRGQFAVIAAFLVIIVLLSAITLSYGRIEVNTFNEPASILNPTQRINKAIDNLLAFSVSYYSSIFNVTGDWNYAQKATVDYLSGGLVKLAHTEADSNPSFNVSKTNFKIKWYKSNSYSNGTINLTYDLPNLGLNGVKYGYSASLAVEALKVVDGKIYVRVYGDGLTDLSLNEGNFKFVTYSKQQKAWVFINPEEMEILNDGTYSLLIPTEISPLLSFLEVRDNRGIMVRTIYIKDLGPYGDNLDDTYYKFDLDWNQTAYPLQMTNDYFPLEYLQNGTLRYLGQSLNKGNEKPIPDIPVRLLRVNQTINSKNSESRFQVEDWSGDFMVPLGIASNNTLFNADNMIVFLVSHRTSEIRIWWDDDDAANQTKYAIENKYFSDNPGNYLLRSNVAGHQFTIDFQQWNAPKYYFKASYKDVDIDSYLGITNSTPPVFPSGMTYVIHDGVVRDVVMQTAVVDTNDPNIPTIYYNYVITLPANCTYYTYQITNTMLETSRERKVTDLSLIKLHMTKNDAKYIMTDLNGNKMEVSNPTIFPSQYKGVNRWVEYINKGVDTNGDNYKGSGILMMQESVDSIFKFDQDLSPDSTGRVDLLNADLQLSPILLKPLTGYHQYSRVTWYGAVMLFSSNNVNDSIYYKSGTQISGLYSMVVYPPNIT